MLASAGVHTGNQEAIGRSSLQPNKDGGFHYTLTWECLGLQYPINEDVPFIIFYYSMSTLGWKAIIDWLHFPTKWQREMNRPSTIWLWTPLPQYRAWHMNRCWSMVSNARVTNSSWFAWNFCQFWQWNFIVSGNPLSRASWTEYHRDAHQLTEFWIKVSSPLANLCSISLINLGVQSLQINKTFSVKKKSIYIFRLLEKFCFFFSIPVRIIS